MPNIVCLPVPVLRKLKLVSLLTLVHLLRALSMEQVYYRQLPSQDHLDLIFKLVK